MKILVLSLMRDGSEKVPSKMFHLMGLKTLTERVVDLPKHLGFHRFLTVTGVLIFSALSVFEGCSPIFGSLTNLDFVQSSLSGSCCPRTLCEFLFALFAFRELAWFNVITTDWAKVQSI